MCLFVSEVLINQLDAKKGGWNIMIDLRSAYIWAGGLGW